MTSAQRAEAEVVEPYKMLYGKLCPKCRQYRRGTKNPKFCVNDLCLYPLMLGRAHAVCLSAARLTLALKRGGWSEDVAVASVASVNGLGIKIH